MTASEQITKRKFSLLQLAEELGNVSKACQLMGYHRDSFYEIKRIYQSATVEEAEQELDAFEAEWGGKYKAVVRLWRGNWDNIIMPSSP